MIGLGAVTGVSIMRAASLVLLNREMGVCRPGSERGKAGQARHAQQCQNKHGHTNSARPEKHEL